MTPAAADATTMQESSTFNKSSDDDAHGVDASSNDVAALYGYEDATPDLHHEEPSHVGRRGSMPYRMPRRSSLKSSDRYRRRASITMGEEITVYLPGQAQPVRRRNSIKFDESVKVMNVDAISKLTDKPRDLWFQSEEYQKIRRNSWDLVNKVERGHTGVGNRKYCLRGLEKMMDRDSILQKRNEAWDSVMAAQDMLHDRGHWDDDIMAKAYRTSTLADAKEAAFRAQEDEKAILNYQSNTRILCRRLSC